MHPSHLLLAALLMLGCAPSSTTAPDDDDDATAAANDDDATADDDDSSDDDDATPTPPKDDAQLVALEFPATLECGATATAQVSMRNSGTATWTRTDGFKLGAVDDSDALIAGDMRAWLNDTDSVAPGAEHVFTIPLQAPDEPGSFLSDWRMVHEAVTWFGETAAATVDVECEDKPDPVYPLPLPDMSSLVDQLAADHPDLLATSCLDDGGGWAFLDLLVDELRLVDERWGYNWKRGVIGEPSEDVVDYHWGPGPHEESEDVYIIDVIVGHCGPSPSPGWGDQTQATLDQGEIGLWTGRGRF